MTMRLLLIRHGAAHHSDRGLIAMPRGCTGLTDAGVAQVGALARRLAATGEAADAVALLTSPVRRVRETADLLRPALPVRGVAVAPGLMELVPGAADGLTLARPAPSPAGWQSAAPPPARSSSPPTATANSPGRRAGRRAAWRPRASPPARSTA